jgi:hypothetical protein
VLPAESAAAWLKAAVELPGCHLAVEVVDYPVREVDTTDHRLPSTNQDHWRHRTQLFPFSSNENRIALLWGDFFVKAFATWFCIYFKCF